MKVSFLLPAHNEEKTIEKSLQNLKKIPYKDYEVLIGLDGCTDKTKRIAQKYCRRNKRFKLFELNSREGKPEVIDKIIKNAKGEIVIIHDSDWIFKFKNKETFQEFISIFNDKKIGGIAESFPVSYLTNLRDNFLGVGVLLHNKIWIDYVKSKGKEINKNRIELNPREFPLLVNVFRKEDYIKNKTLGDDFERFFHIISKNKKIIATNNPDLPRMISVGEKYTIQSLLKQKERTAHARRQLKNISHENKLPKTDFFKYLVKKSIKMSLREFSSFMVVNLIFIISTIRSKFKKITTKDGWNMRNRRKENFKIIVP